jgi:DnaJ-class molecular chaperone
MLYGKLPPSLGASCLSCVDVCVWPQSLFDFDKACRDFQALVDADPSDKQWNRRLSDARSLRDMTHYQILGLPLEADAAAIKKAYRTLCLRWHPDKHTASVEAQQRANTAFMVRDSRCPSCGGNGRLPCIRVQRINEANDVLTDSYKRMLYDLEKRPAILAAQAKGPDADTFEKWFTKVLVPVLDCETSMVCPVSLLLWLLGTRS